MKMFEVFLFLDMLYNENKEIPSPFELAYELAKKANLNNTELSKRQKGQYFTIPNLACYAATKINTHKKKKEVKILDAGAGTGILSAALITILVKESRFEKFSLFCYENDKTIITPLEETIEALKKYAEANGKMLDSEIIQEDFLADTSKEKLSKFDYVISNPPFFKIEKVEKNNTNIYSYFIKESISRLKENGEFLFILPISFVSGGSYKKEREKIISKIEIKSIDYFDSSVFGFDDSGRLNKYLIITGTKKDTVGNNYKITNNYFYNNGTVFSYSINFDKNRNILPIIKSNEDLTIFIKHYNNSVTLKSLGFEIIKGEAKKSEINNFKELKDGSEDIGIITYRNFSHLTEMLSTIKLNKEPETLIIKPINGLIISNYNTFNNESKIVLRPFIIDDYNIKSIILENKLSFIFNNKYPIDPYKIQMISDALQSEEMNRYVYMIYGNINIPADDILDLPINVELKIK